MSTEAGIEEFERYDAFLQRAIRERYAENGPLHGQSQPVSVDPEHQSAYQRLLALRQARALSQDEFQQAIQTFVPTVTVTPSPRQAEAQMFYYSEMEEAVPPHGTYPNPVQILPPPAYATEFQAMWHRGREVVQMPPPAPTPPQNPLHSIKPIPRKIVMDRD